MARPTPAGRMRSKQTRVKANTAHMGHPGNVQEFPAGTKGQTRGSPTRPNPKAPPKQFMKPKAQPSGPLSSTGYKPSSAQARVPRTLPGRGRPAGTPP